MRLLLATLSLALCLLLAPSPSPAAVSDGMPEWRGLQRVAPGPQRARRATVKRSKARGSRATSRRVARGSRAPAARRAPATTPAIAVEPATVQTPFGTRTRTVAHRAGVPGRISAFLADVQARCGSVRVISTFRPGARIAGTGRTSCHASGQAVDYTTGNPSCALAVANSGPWRSLGHSNDYGRVAHFHVSVCAQEAGVRFAHGGGRAYARRGVKRTRYARRASRRG